MRRVLVLLVLAGCSRAAPTPVVTDSLLVQHVRAGRLALTLDRPAEAVTQFRAGLSRAELRDDAGAIGDLGFDLATAELAANQPVQALADARQTRAELIRRGAPPLPVLTLVEAIAAYRTNAPAQADALAASLETAADPDIAAGAAFLRGLIADERGDAGGLSAALQRLNDVAPGTEHEADRAELLARLSLRAGDPATARQSAMQSADLRRTAHDYRGLARCLALAADAAQRTGDRAGAAELYLRAGRSAAVQSDAEDARPWLRRALSFSTDPSLIAAAHAALTELDKTTAKP